MWYADICMFPNVLENDILFNATLHRLHYWCPKEDFSNDLLSNTTYTQSIQASSIIFSMGPQL